jgi:hypothetical protein
LSRGTPVAALIVIRPGVQVNTIEGDSLSANGDAAEMRPNNIAIEAVLVHAQIGRGIAQANESRQKLGGYDVMERSFGWSAWRGVLHSQRSYRTCGSGRLGTSCHSVLIVAGGTQEM